MDLPIFIPEHVVPVALDGGEDLESAGGGFLYLLLVGKAAPILNGNEVSHVLVQLGVHFEDAS